MDRLPERRAGRHRKADHADGAGVRRSTRRLSIAIRSSARPCPHLNGENEMDLNEKTAIVTGAGSGIGYAIAERLAEAGAAVCVNYLDHEQEAKVLAAR